MKELSIFIDESGDFGEYSHHSPFYIVTMIFHKQSHPIDHLINKLDNELSMLGFQNHCIHSAPIIRQEEEYRFLSIETRRKIFNKMVAFFRQLDIQYKCFHIEKRHIADVTEASEKLSKILSSVLYALLPNVEFRKVIPFHYRLFQVADLVCTFELLRLKLENHTLSKSELKFFGTEKDLKKNYLRHISKKSL